MNKTFDVLIIGAGPAGGSAALHCAKAGLSVLVIEEHEKIGEPVHCGECLSEYACKNIGLELPKEVISEIVKGIRTIYPNNKKTIVPENGFVLEKEKFEQWLGEKAKDAGAEIKLGEKVVGVERKNMVWKIKTTKGTMESRILIDASGITSFVSTKLGLNKRFDSVIGVQYELKDIKRDGYLDFYIWPKLAPEGYLWMIPKSNGRANVGLVTHEKNNAKKYLDEFIKEKKWGKKTRVKTFGGLIPISGPLEKTFGEGLMLIGDAAGFTSPMFEGGTHLGLKSGQMAAQIAKEAIRKNDFSEELFSKYNELHRNEFPDYKKILKGKKAFYNFSEEELNFVAKNLPDTFEGFNFFKKVIFGLKIAVGKPNLLKPSFFRAMRSLEYSNAKFYGW